MKLLAPLILGCTLTANTWLHGETVTNGSGHAATRDELLTKAEADRTAKHFEAALTGYTAVLRLEPRNGQTWLRRAACLRALHRYEDAILDTCRAHAALTLAGADKHALALALCARADLARESGDLNCAFASAFAANKTDNACAEAISAVADTWYAAGSFIQAQSALSLAQKIDPTITRPFTADGATRNSHGKVLPDATVNTGAEFLAGGTAFNKKNYPEAVARYDHLLALQPLNENAWGNRASALYMQDHPAAAVISASNAAALAASTNGKSETIANFYTNRLNSWLDAHDYEAALVDGELTIRISPEKASSWVLLASTWLEWGDLEKAKANFAEAKKRDAKATLDGLDEPTAAAKRLARLALTGDLPTLQKYVQAAAENTPPLFETNKLRAGVISVIDGLLKFSPRDCELIILRALAEDTRDTQPKHGTTKAALTWIDRAIAFEPNNGHALLVRGIFRTAVFEDETSEHAGFADLDRAIQLGAGNAEAFARRAAAAQSARKFPAAIADYSAALKLDPDDIPLLERRAYCYEQDKQLPKALADLSRIIELKPKESAPLVSRAALLLTLGDLPRALLDFDAAVKLDQKNPDLYLGRAHVLRLQGKRDRALADHRQARALDSLLPELAADWSNAEAIEALRDNFAHRSKRIEQQSEAADEATRAMLKARVQARLRRLTEKDERTPEQILTEVAQSEKDEIADAYDYRDRASALARLNRLDEALPALDRAIELEVEHAGAHSMRGRIYELRKEYDLAFADYDLAVTIEPENADYHRDRGDIWTVRKSYGMALADYDAAVKADGENTKNWGKRADTHFRLHEFAAAIADYDRTIELDPEDSDAKENRKAAKLRLAAP